MIDQLVRHRTPSPSAIDWQSLGDNVVSEAFQGLIAQRLAAFGTAPAFKTFDDVLMSDGGAGITGDTIYVDAGRHVVC